MLCCYIGKDLSACNTTSPTVSMRRPLNRAWGTAHLLDTDPRLYTFKPHETHKESSKVLGEWDKPLKKQPLTAVGLALHRAAHACDVII